MSFSLWNIEQHTALLWDTAHKYSSAIQEGTEQKRNKGRLEIQDNSSLAISIKLIPNGVCALGADKWISNI